MRLKDANVLLLTRTMHLGGTENVVLQICEILYPEVNKVIVCSCGGVNVKKLKKMGIKHYTIPDIASKNAVTMVEISMQLNRIILKEQIDVIHTHHRMAAFYVAALRLYKNRVFINTSHNTFGDKRRLTQFAYRHADMIACGEMVKRNLVDFFHIPENRMAVIHNAVRPFDKNTEADRLIEDLHSQGCFIVGNIGRLTEQKGMGYFIKAIPMIITKHPEARFAIIGSGEEEQKLIKLANEEGVGKYLYFLGYRDDIQNLMSQLDLIVLSSLWEGLPLTPIEAYSVGKTIIATAVDGTIEIVRDGIDGFLVEPRDPEKIANKVNYLIEDPERKKNMEFHALERYKDRFSYERLAYSYIEYYKGLLL